MIKSRPQKLIAVVVLVILIGTGITVLVTRNLSKPKPQEETKVIVYSPTAEFLRTKLTGYVGKDIGLKGSVIQINKAYYVVSSGKDSGLVKLDFSKTRIDPKKYADPTSKTLGKVKEGQTAYSGKGPYTVTGTVKAVAGQSLFIVVKSIH